MRKLILAGAALLMVGATPGFARDYPWCARSVVNGGNPQCDFSTFRQCQATISGQGGSCLPNPAFASGPTGNRRPTRDYRGDRGDWGGGSNWGAGSNRW